MRTAPASARRPGFTVDEFGAILRVALFALGTVVLSTQVLSQPIPSCGEPPWLRERIEQYAHAPLGQAPESVWRYQVEGTTVYLIPAAQRDQSDQLFNAKGDYLCSTGGSIVPARGESRCTANYTAPTGMHLVWQDPRLGITHHPDDRTR